MPPALAVIDPHRSDSAYPYRHLAGVGVAYKLLAAIYEGMGRQAELEAYLDLVALGTVRRHDAPPGRKPLPGNRRHKTPQVVPARGPPRAGSAGRRHPGKLEAEHISWALAPRLNAAGRLEHALSGYRLLTTESAEEARNLSQWLNDKNTERQKLTAPP